MIKKYFLLLIFILSLAINAFADTKVATDPTRLGVGARILGMGKAYLGLADDLSGIFINPAALSSVDQWQATSMSGKFINEFMYLNTGVAWPTDFGTFGLGYVGSGINFTAPAPTTEVIDGVRIIPSTTEGISYGFNDRVFLLSWGNKIEHEVGDFSLGATYKLFNLDLSGSGMTDTSASGNELDLGLHFWPEKSVKVGFVAQNVLPATFGGKIEWRNGTVETLPSSLKAGLSFKLLGEDGFRKIGKHELTANIDGDFYLFRLFQPTLFHAGLEWSPIDLIDLRVGIDQDYVGTGWGHELIPTNNFTAGVGIYISNFRFDYAYHQYNQVTANDTHYFSLTYGVGKKPPEKKEDVFSVTPADKSIFFTERVTFEGEVLSSNVSRISINEVDLAIEGNQFRAGFPLRLKKNTFRVKASDRGAELIEAKKIRILRLKGFKDISPKYWAGVAIGILATENVIAGYPDHTFRPEGKITRAEMCTLLVKALDRSRVPVTGKNIFPDVSSAHWAAKYITLAVEDGLVNGYLDGTFKPDKKITRDEGVTILSRFAGLRPPLLVEIPFKDLPGRHWSIKYVAAAKNAGLLRYLEGKRFEPDRPLTRAEVAEMLSRTKYFSEKIRDIMDWNRGYL